MASRRHHYIPVFYLRQWAGEDDRVCEFSRPFNRIVPKRVHPNGTAYQDNLYALKNVPEHLVQYLEDNFLKVADQQANDALQLLLNGGLNSLSQKLRTGWSRFLMSLLARTPDKIAMLRDMYERELGDGMAELEVAYDAAHLGIDPPPSAEQKAADILRQLEIGVGQFIQSAMDLPKVGQEFNNMKWSVNTLQNGKRTLLTSDKPIYLSNGLQHDDSYVSLPISPTKIFIAAKDQSILDRIAKMEGGDLTGNSNIIVAQQAEKFVYGTDDYQRNFVDKYLRPI